MVINETPLPLTILVQVGVLVTRLDISCSIFNVYHSMFWMAVTYIVDMAVNSYPSRLSKTSIGSSIGNISIGIFLLMWCVIGLTSSLYITYIYRINRLIIMVTEELNYSIFSISIHLLVCDYHENCFSIRIILLATKMLL